MVVAFDLFIIFRSYFPLRKELERSGVNEVCDVLSFYD